MNKIIIIIACLSTACGCSDTEGAYKVQANGISIPPFHSAEGSLRPMKGEQVGGWFSTSSLIKL